MRVVTFSTSPKGWESIFEAKSPTTLSADRHILETGVERRMQEKATPIAPVLAPPELDDAPDEADKTKCAVKI
jgi:hypothetical protein